MTLKVQGCMLFPFSRSPPQRVACCWISGAIKALEPLANQMGAAANSSPPRQTPLRFSVAPVWSSSVQKEGANESGLWKARSSGLYQTTDFHGYPPRDSHILHPLPVPGSVTSPPQPRSTLRTTASAWSNMAAYIISISPLLLYLTS